MERSNVAMIAVAWFRPEEWPDLKRLCPDLHDTYEEWRTNAEAGIEAFGSPLKEQIVKVILTVDELRQWNRANEGEVNSKVRSHLAIKKAAAKSNRTSH